MIAGIQTGTNRDKQGQTQKHTKETKETKGHPLCFPQNKTYFLEIDDSIFYSFSAIFFVKFTSD